MGVELHIEELVLHGFEARDRRRIAGEVERELTRLIGEGGLRGLGGSLAIERVNAGEFKVRAGAKPHAAGTQIAHSIYRSLRQARTPRVGPGAGGGGL
jgi:hypothetical protein